MTWHSRLIARFIIVRMLRSVLSSTIMMIRLFRPALSGECISAHYNFSLSRGLMCHRAWFIGLIFVAGGYVHFIASRRGLELTRAQCLYQPGVLLRLLIKCISQYANHGRHSFSPFAGPTSVRLQVDRCRDDVLTSSGQGWEATLLRFSPTQLAKLWRKFCPQRSSASSVASVLSTRTSQCLYPALVLRR